MLGSRVLNASDNERFFTFFYAVVIKEGTKENCMRVGESKAGTGLDYVPT